MVFGTTYNSIEDVVKILEEHLHLKMARHDDGEIGVHYSWAEPPDAFGASYLGFSVRPTWFYDDEDQKHYLGHPDWAPYRFVIGISDELEAFNSRIRYLIERGELQAEEIPPPQPSY